MEPEFKNGDLVKLKSGGPVMTIQHITPQGVVSCVWMDNENKYFNKFMAVTLMHA